MHCSTVPCRQSNPKKRHPQNRVDQTLRITNCELENFYVLMQKASNHHCNLKSRSTSARLRQTCLRA